MPWTTLAVVIGSWFLLLILTLLHFFVWSRRGGRNEGPGPR